MTMHLVREIERLKRLILSLSAVVEENVQKSVAAIVNRDAVLAEEVIAADLKVDQLEIEVEEECLKALALHQPVAVDLRYIVAVLKINNDLERIGDLAVNISDRALHLCELPEISIGVDFGEICRKSCKMLRISLDSLMNMDVKRAQEVLTLDDEVDELDRRIHKRILKSMRESPELIEPLMTYRAASRHLERIADYATNISEDVVYMIEGWIVRHGAPRPRSVPEASAQTLQERPPTFGPPTGNDR